MQNLVYCSPCDCDGDTTMLHTMTKNMRLVSLLAARSKYVSSETICGRR